MEYKKSTSWYAIYIETNVEQTGLWKAIWGTDIFINGVPILKLFLLLNILVWLF